MNTLLVGQAPLLRFGSGYTLIDPQTGAPTQFVDPENEQRQYLLTDELLCHTPDHVWGSGYVITSDGAAQWQAPHELEVSESEVRAVYWTHLGLKVRVTRSGADVLQERYEFFNESDQDMVLESVGIQTPFGDLYQDSESALTKAVNAHIFTAGEWAWAYAEPMSGEGKILGLTVTEGALWSYGIESRNPTTSSNFRGHIVLNVTDSARAPHAFGGQPRIHLAPGESYTLTWELAWFDSVAEFVNQTAAPADFDRVAAPLGEEIRIRTSLPVTVQGAEAADAVSITDSPDSDGAAVAISATEPGTYQVNLGDAARTEVLFYRPIREVVGSRIDYILAHQRPVERPGTLGSAFVPVDTRTKHQMYANGWLDWTDGSERIGMALMMQRAQKRGWTSPEADDALAGWAQFAREHLLDSSYAPRRGAFLQDSEIRLYDMPWLTLFFIDRYRTTNKAEDLDLAANILNRGFELGIGRFLAIGLPEACTKTADQLDAAGRQEEAQQLREALLSSAQHFVEAGRDLPVHEVSYEQSMVAPLLELMIYAHRLTGQREYFKAIEERLPWLLAFSGPQQHVRLKGVPIRHWDGYWFGIRRQWGDVFPHHWSSLTAAVLARLPEQLRNSETDALAQAILRSNLTSYFDDGSATCAFVFPSTVDGESAHVPDPLANDQEWPLAIWLELAESESVPLS